MKLKLGFLLFITTMHMSTVHAQSDELNCKDPVKTFEINACEALKVETAEKKLEQYLAESLKTIKEEKESIAALLKSQTSWKVYREEYCSAIYEQWSGGSIRGYMFHACQLKLTKQRTHNLWQDYLTYMDSTPPRLPEPKL